MDAPLAVTSREVQTDDVLEHTPARPPRRRFAVAIPLVTTLLMAAALTGVWAIVAGMSGELVRHPMLWTYGLPIVAIVSAAAGVRGAMLGWQDDRRAGPWRPLAFGLGIGLAVSTGGFALVQSMALLS